MSGGDRIQPLFPGKRGKPAIAQLAARSFNAQLGGESVVTDIAVPDEELQAVMSCQVRDERLVRVGLLAAQAMIEVGHCEHDA